MRKGGKKVKFLQCYFGSTPVVGSSFYKVISHIENIRKENEVLKPIPCYANRVHFIHLLPPCSIYSDTFWKRLSGTVK